MVAGSGVASRRAAGAVLGLSGKDARPRGALDHRADRLPRRARRFAPLDAMRLRRRPRLEPRHGFLHPPIAYLHCELRMLAPRHGDTEDHARVRIRGVRGISRREPATFEPEVDIAVD